MFDNTHLEKRNILNDAYENDQLNLHEMVFDSGPTPVNHSKRLFRGSFDSNFHMSRPQSRSNSIHHNPNAFHLFMNDMNNTPTPYRNSPAENPLSPYNSNNYEISHLDLVNLNVAVPLPSRVAPPKTQPIQGVERSPKNRSPSSDSDTSQPVTSGKKDNQLVNDLIQRFLEEKAITKDEWDALRSEEQIILNCLIRRKLGFDIHEYIKCKGNLKEGAVKCKRLEENYKMVFKGALKYLSANFKERKSKKKSKAEDIAFYQFYFGSVANDLNPLETFFHPNK